jgi:hypothetical protein
VQATVEKSPFGFVDIVQLRFVGGVGDALVEGRNALVAIAEVTRSQIPVC